MSQPVRPEAPPWRSYRTNDARFAVPPDWADRSVVMLTAPPAVGGAADGEAPDGAPGCSLTVHHDALRPGEDLAAYGAPGWEAEFRSTDARGLRLRQHQVSVLRPGPPPGRVLTWTATALAAHYADYADAFAAVLASVHLVRPAFTIAGPGTRGE